MLGAGIDQRRVLADDNEDQRHKCHAEMSHEPSSIADDGHLLRMRGRADGIAGRGTERRYFHGGYGGLEPGDRVLPPSETGHKLPRVVSASYSPRHVYVAPSFWYAAIFALPFHRPPHALAVYEVRPRQPLAADPERAGGFMCPSARVIRRVSDGLSRAELDALLRWEIEVRRRFDCAATAADLRWAVRHIPTRADRRLLREFALCLPTPGDEPEIVPTAARFPELVEAGARR